MKNRVLILGALLIVTLASAHSRSSFAQTCEQAPHRAIGWWPADGSSDDIRGANYGTLVGNIVFDSGAVGQSFLLNGIVDAVLIPRNSASLQLEAGDFTIEAWVRTTSDYSDGLLGPDLDLACDLPGEVEGELGHADGAAGVGADLGAEQAEDEVGEAVEDGRQPVSVVDRFRASNSKTQ